MLKKTGFFEKEPTMVETEMKKEIHTKKWHEMVKAIKKKGGAVSAEAVANSRLGKKAFLKSSRRKSGKSKSYKDNYMKLLNVSRNFTKA